MLQLLFFYFYLVWTDYLAFNGRAGYKKSELQEENKLFQNKTYSVQFLLSLQEGHYNTILISRRHFQHLDYRSRSLLSSTVGMSNRANNSHLIGLWRLHEVMKKASKNLNCVDWKVSKQDPGVQLPSFCIPVSLIYELRNYKDLVIIII